MSPANADRHYDVIAEALQRPEFRPRALFEKFNIEVIATTESALDDLRWHKSHSRVGLARARRHDLSAGLGRRPGVSRLSRQRRQARRDRRRGRDDLVTAISPRIASAAPSSRRTARRRPITDIRAPRPQILRPPKREALFARVDGRRPFASGRRTLPGADVDRNGGDEPRRRARRCKSIPALGAITILWFTPASAATRARDIPTQTDYVHALKPLLDRFGNEKSLTVILFTLDETAYSRELAPLAGHYPALRLGPPWWFFDRSPACAAFAN